MSALDDKILERLNADPVLQELFGTRVARYRYWETPDGWQFHYTVETLADGKYASAVYRPIGKGSRSGKATRLTVSRELHSATRRGAKARAYRMYLQHKTQLEARGGG